MLKTCLCFSKFFLVCKENINNLGSKIKKYMCSLSFISKVKEDIDIFFDEIKNGPAITIIVLILTICFPVIIAIFCIPEYFTRIHNFLMGIFTGLVILIFTACFIQYLFNIQDKKDRKQKEKEHIMRFNRILNIYITEYKKAISQLVEPYNQSLEIDFPEDFDFSSLKNMYNICLDFRASFGKATIIDMFFQKENNLENKIIETLERINFDYYTDIYEVLIDFINYSEGLNTRHYIANAHTVKANNKTIKDIAIELIKEYNGNIEEDWRNKKYYSHVLTPYILLYFMIKNEIDILKKYEELINNL